MDRLGIRDSESHAELALATHMVRVSTQRWRLDDSAFCRITWHCCTFLSFTCMSSSAAAFPFLAIETRAVGSLHSPLVMNVNISFQKQ